MANYKTIKGHTTIWKGEHKPLYQRLIYKLYKKYVNYPYLPEDVHITVQDGTKTNQSRALKIRHKTVCNEDYFFSKIGENDPDRIHII